LFAVTGQEKVDRPVPTTIGARGKKGCKAKKKSPDFYGCDEITKLGGRFWGQNGLQKMLYIILKPE
jgi:hypothetical protein